MSDARRLVDELWSSCNVLRDDGVSTIDHRPSVVLANPPFGRKSSITMVALEKAAAERAAA